MENADIQIATFNYFEIEMPTAAVEECHHVGECYDDVTAWQPRIDLSHVSDQDLKKELKEYGAWDDEELNDRIENEKRIIWIAAGYIQDLKKEL